MFKREIVGFRFPCLSFTLTLTLLLKLCRMCYPKHNFSSYLQVSVDSCCFFKGPYDSASKLWVIDTEIVYICHHVTEEEFCVSCLCCCECMWPRWGGRLRQQWSGWRAGGCSTGQMRDSFNPKVGTLWWLWATTFRFPSDCADSASSDRFLPFSYHVWLSHKIFTPKISCTLSRWVVEAHAESAQRELGLGLRSR